MSLKNLSVTNKIPKFFQSKLKNKKINQIYKKFEKSLNIDKNFIVAVSGGPDSLALAFLAKIYSIKKNVHSKFYIVDHKLRSGSTDEAKLVQKILKKKSIKCEILTWKGKKPSSNIQSLARTKRYELLFAKCDKFKIDYILTGHHQDDLLENFFIRMSRGSGLKGLISLDKKIKNEGKYLLRPLLDQKKKDLKFISKSIFNFFVIDPSNNEDKFQRIKIRKIISEFKNNGLDEKKFHKTIKNLKHANTIAEYYVAENIKKNSFFLNKKNRLILNKYFFQQPYEIIFRAFSDSIKKIGKKYYSTRGKKIDKIIQDIKNDRLFRATLGGCIIEKVNDTVIVRKEH